MKHFPSLCISLVLLFPAVLFSQEDGAKVKGDKASLRSAPVGPITIKGKAYEKVVLIADSKGSIDWDYDEDAFPESRSEVCPNEKKLILFPVAKGTYRVRLLLWEEKRFQKYTIVIEGGTPPAPPPGPGPGPGPIDPPIPPSPPVVETLGFVTLARAELAKLPLDVKGMAGAIADNFEAVSAKLAATASMTVEDALADLKARHQRTLGDNRQYWLPWFTAWKAKADTLNANGTMITKDHYVIAFRETAVGLR